MKTIIVAGGRGERLRPITNQIPKPMVKVAGQPILEHTLALLSSHGVKDFIFALCYLPEVITRHFGDGQRLGVNITYTYEHLDFPLGTAGAISPAREYINDTFIVTYADILRELNITDMLKQHRRSQALITLNVYKRYGPNPKSLVVFNEDRRVIDFQERPNMDIAPDSFVWANGSFYILEPEIFRFIPDGQSIDFAQDVFPKALAAGERIFAYPTEGYFIDIGTLEKLEKARRTFKT